MFAFIAEHGGFGYSFVYLGSCALLVALGVLFAVLGKLSDLLLVTLTRPLVAWQDGFRR